MGTGGDESRLRQVAYAAALCLALLAGLPVAYAAEPLYSTDQVERDLEFLRRTVRKVHPALASDEASAAFDMRVNQLLDGLDGPMTRMDVALAATQVVRCLPEPDAHTTVEYDGEIRFSPQAIAQRGHGGPGDPGANGSDTPTSQAPPPKFTFTGDLYVLTSVDTFSGGVWIATVLSDTDWPRSWASPRAEPLQLTVISSSSPCPSRG